MNRSEREQAADAAAKPHVIWIVLKVAQAAIPVCWRATEQEAIDVANALRSKANDSGVRPPYLFVLPVSDEVAET